MHPVAQPHSSQPSALSGLAALPPDTRNVVQDLRAAGRLPEHVAIIMDGNGRWARRQGKDRSAGHRAGADSVRAVTRLAREVGLKSLNCINGQYA